MYRALAVPSSAPCAVEVSELLQFPFPSPGPIRAGTCGIVPVPRAHLTPPVPLQAPSLGPGSSQLLLLQRDGNGTSGLTKSHKLQLPALFTSDTDLSRATAPAPHSDLLLTPS